MPRRAIPSDRLRGPQGSHARLFSRAGGLAFVLLVLVIGALGCARMGVGRPPRPIQTRSPVAPVRVVSAEPVEPRTLLREVVPEHPFMAPHGASCMHSDPYTTNTYHWAGPVGEDAEVASRSNGLLGGECPTVNFDRQGRIITVCVRSRQPALMLLDPRSLRVIDKLELPKRRVPMLRFRAATNDTSGGAYFYLDERDRAVVGTSDGTIDIIATRETEDGPRFFLDERFDLSEVLRLPSGELDKITAVMPDWQGNLWFVGRLGSVGVAMRDGRIHGTRLEGEEIENSFSMAEDGAYIVSDHALYRFELDANAQPTIVWRETYDRGTRRKVGQINQGSGTTPTLLGADYVAIGDNAEPRMNVLVYRRDRESSSRRICAVPVFEPGASATENTLIGHQRSLIVENNAGYDIFFTMRRGRTSSPGLARVDIRPDESGCDVVWTNHVVSQTTVPKLSTATGLIYAYTKRPNAPDRTDAYYFTGIDFETGRTAFMVPTGNGVRYDNHWAAVTLAPDGSAYVGVLNGLVRIRDRATDLLDETLPR